VLVLLIAAAKQQGWRRKARRFVVEGRDKWQRPKQFYCNIKALTPEERARHKQLSEKLNAQRKEIVETEKATNSV